ncbi:GNAT family N-acetyltransferase [Paenibacillus sp. TRM 82003]|uniref:GNAT family N-acetyltransferase n=1 Tax=Kineococcus sp. TRM81007 TaxID=2925831 RepID=UPI001F56F2C2|nr:GNAT family N-acetyltransferase [Kineococcus sp. TRM81007]MCI2238655.1 GNAT family N-acetyltransferase [Kineococcus sp. TRM81007]MCI3927317.1 GNAT family N-acetyltransferase [Paenibacillus sp. TRM 82003]
MTDPELTADLARVDFGALDAALREDGFHNGRTPDELRRSCENSHATVFALDGGRVVAMGRLLSDGVGNAYLVDVWTATAHRHRGIGSEVVRRLVQTVPGQHVALFTDDAGEFYGGLGFSPQEGGMSRVVGRWLGRFDPPPRPA